MKNIESADMMDVASPAEQELHRSGEDYAEYLRFHLTGERRKEFLDSNVLKSDDLVLLDDFLDNEPAENFVKMDPDKRAHLVQLIDSLKVEIEGA